MNETKINGREIEIPSSASVWVGHFDDSCCIRFMQPCESPVTGTLGPANLANEDGKQALRLRISIDAAYALHALLGEMIDADLKQVPR